MIKQLFIFFTFVMVGFCARAQSIYGIDVSDYQGNINWTQVKAAGVTYAWAKATEGITLTDGQYVNNATNGVSAGVYMGAYHFAHPDTHTTTAGALSEAHNFLNAAKPYIISCELPPVLDYEVSSSMSWTQQTAWIKTWMDTVKLVTGITPILYTDGSIASSLGSSLASYCKLWIATDNGSTATAAEVIPPSPAPPTPSAYDQGSWNPNWAFNQYSWTTTVNGISGQIDADIFNGTLTDLKTLMGCSTTPPVCNYYYASLPYTTSFENIWLYDSCSIGAQRIPDKYWKNTIGGTTPNGNDYWHRDDYTGADWTSVTTGSYSPTASAGTHSAKFHNDPPPASSTGALDLYINLSAAGTKQISFDYIHDEASPSPFSFDVLLSTNGGTTFPTTLLTISTASYTTWTTQTFTTNATSATGVIRFMVTDKGTKDVGIDNLNIITLTTTGINQLETGVAVTVYPNPNTGNFIIKTNDATKHIRAEVYNQLGQLVLSKESNTGEDEMQINDLSEGAYFVNVYAEGVKITTQKLVVLGN